MKTLPAALLASLLILLSPAADAFGHDHRIGAGANYWVAVSDIDVDNLDEDGFGYFISYQYRPTLIGFDLALEFLPDHLGDDAIAPQASLILGSALYVAGGIGVLYTDGAFLDEPFYALRAGLDLQVLPSLYLDISANYRFSRRSDLRDDGRKIDTDTIFLGAALRLGF